MAKQDVDVELYYSAAWQNVTGDTYTRDDISINRGLADESLEPFPGSARLTFDNRAGTYNPNNPVSPLYGLVGRNTPLRVAVDGDVRLSCEVADWQPRRSIEPASDERGDAWTAVEGAGILRRLGRGQKPLKEPLYRAIVADNPVAYWPLDDGDQATEATSGLPGGTPMTILRTPDLAAVDGPAGAPGKFPQLIAPSVESNLEGQGDWYTGAFTAPVAGVSSTAWTVEGIFYVKAEADYAFGASFVGLRWRTDGTLGAFGWRVRPGDFVDASFPPVGNFVTVNMHSSATAGSGPSLDESSALTPGQWHHFRVSAEQDGADVNVELYLDGTLHDSTTETSQTLGKIVEIGVGSPMDTPPGVGIDAWPDGVEVGSIAHVAIFNSFDPGDHSEAMLGHVGEKAGTRFLRLCTEEDIPAQLFGTEADTQAMGAQPSDKLLEVLLECARTDAGMMYEPRTILGLIMRSGRDLCNQDPVLELDYDAGDVAPPLEPIIGDQGTRNHVTAKRRGGGSVPAVLETGRLSIQDPPNGVGKYDSQLDVNTETDGVLADHAGWHLHKGTVDETRYRLVTVDLDASPGLVTDVNAVNIGDKITITNLPDDDSPDDASLLVVAVAELIGSHRRKVTFTTVPASVYEVGFVGADDGSTNLRGQAIDTDNSTLATGINAVTTSLSVASTGGVLWTTVANDWDTTRNGGGLFIRIGGEDMRVTNITGASSPQTFTVVRSINGVVKSHSSGAAVHTRYPIVVAL